MNQTFFSLQRSYWPHFFGMLTFMEQPSLSHQACCTLKQCNGISKHKPPLLTDCLAYLFASQWDEILYGIDLWWSAVILQLSNSQMLKSIYYCHFSCSQTLLFSLVFAGPWYDSCSDKLVLIPIGFLSRSSEKSGQWTWWSVWYVWLLPYSAVNNRSTKASSVCSFRLFWWACFKGSQAGKLSCRTPSRSGLLCKSSSIHLQSWSHGWCEWLKRVLFGSRGIRWSCLEGYRNVASHTTIWFQSCVKFVGNRFLQLVQLVKGKNMRLSQRASPGSQNCSSFCLLFISSLKFSFLIIASGEMYMFQARRGHVYEGWMCISFLQLR